MLLVCINPWLLLDVLLVRELMNRADLLVGFGRMSSWAAEKAIRDGWGEQAEKAEKQEEMFEVQKILAYRVRGTSSRRIEYQVKWDGYVETTWEPEENLEDCVELLDEFWRHKARPIFAENRKRKEVNEAQNKRAKRSKYEEEESVVDRILSHEGKPGNYWYWVRWHGHSESDDTCEPEENLQDNREILEEYKAKHGL